MSSLLGYLRLHHRFADLEDITDQAVQTWLDKAKADGIHQRPATVHGYQWKELFLPDGTRLRSRNYEHFKYAAVQGDDLLYEGRAVSPNQFNTAVPGITRNAWRDIFLLFPGARQWKRAADCRREVTVSTCQPTTQPHPSWPSQPVARAGVATRATPLQPPPWDGAERRAGYRRREDLLLE
jgi:hypothetical protein